MEKYIEQLTDKFIHVTINNETKFISIEDILYVTCGESNKRIVTTSGEYTHDYEIESDIFCYLEEIGFSYVQTSANEVTYTNQLIVK